MIKILIAEDEKPIANLIKLSLTKAGYLCDCAENGAIAADMIEKYAYDLVLLDVMMPEVDGYELMDYIRPLEIPVIFITAKGTIEDRVKGLKMGAEDYMVKPFAVAELLARVDVVLRRNLKTSGTIEVGGLTIDVRSMRVRRGDEEIHLTRKEYELLLFFASNPNTALYRETIYERVWGGYMDYGSKTVDLHVQRLRKKVGWNEELQAVSKVGYRLEVG